MPERNSARLPLPVGVMIRNSAMKPLKSLKPLQKFLGLGLYGAGCIILGTGMQIGNHDRVGYGLALAIMGMTVMWPPWRR
jgi:hypothetical protein